MAARSSLILQGMRRIAKVHAHTMAIVKPEELPLDVPIEEENAPGYRPQDFYHAAPGEVLNKRYRLVAKLGYGSSSTVWLAHTTSRILRKSEYVAIKIKNCSMNSVKDAEHETAISKIIQRAGSVEDRTHVCTTNGSFELQGPHGQHICLVMEPLRDPLWLMRRRICGPKVTAEYLPIFKLYIKALLTGLDYLHSKCKIIHTDLKIDNIMFDFESPEVIENFAAAQLKHPMARKTYKDHAIYRCHNDFGNILEVDKSTPALLMMPPKFTDFGLAQRGDTGQPLLHPIQPDHCHAPEVILGLTWSYSADIWNFGAMIYDLLAGQSLFTHIKDASGVYSAKHHLAEMTKLLGPIPPSMLQNVLEKGNDLRWAPPVPNPHGKLADTANEYFDGPFYTSNGQLIHTDLDPPLPPEKSWETSLPDCIVEDKADFIDFMQKMLCWSPDRRSTAAELWKHPWLKI